MPHDLRSFFDRAHLQNIIGMAGAGVFVVLLSWTYADHSRLLIYLAIQLSLVALMGFAFYGRLAGGKRDADGIPSLALPTIVASHVATSTVLFFDLDAAREPNFVFGSMVVFFGCIAGSTVTLGPVRRLARAAQLSLLLPPLVAATILEYWFLALGGLFFIAVVTVVGAEQMHQSFQELVTLRAESARQSEVDRLRATTDDLTSLLNRRGVDERFHAEPGGHDWILYLDLDRFKQVNDEAGHLAGDEMLIQVANRLIGAVPETSTVARMGGDEFVVLLRTGVVEDIDALVNRVRFAIEPPFALSAGHWSVGVSVGAARIEPGRSFEMVLHESDSAMFRAKDANRSRPAVVQHRIAARPMH